MKKIDKIVEILKIKKSKIELGKMDELNGYFQYN
jgi:hypothetical protein